MCEYEDGEYQYDPYSYAPPLVPEPEPITIDPDLLLLKSILRSNCDEDPCYLEDPTAPECVICSEAGVKLLMDVKEKLDKLRTGEGLND